MTRRNLGLGLLAAAAALGLALPAKPAAAAWTPWDVYGSTRIQYRFGNRADSTRENDQHYELFNGYGNPVRIEYGITVASKGGSRVERSAVTLGPGKKTRDWYWGTRLTSIIIYSIKHQQY
jgi:hypothetical protein